MLLCLKMKGLSELNYFSKNSSRSISTQVNVGCFRKIVPLFPGKGIYEQIATPKGF